MDEHRIQSLIERLGQAISSGDAREVSACWAYPALFVSDAGAVPLAEAGQVEAFIAQGIEWYRQRGIVSTRGELERVDVLSDWLAAVDVRWPSFDASGREVGSERSHYILHLGEDGQARVAVGLTRTR